VRWVTWGRFKNGRDEFEKKELGKKNSARKLPTRTPQEKPRKRTLSKNFVKEPCIKNLVKELCRRTLSKNPVDERRTTTLRKRFEE
jgi:hypothetical protein